jgi:hypothetical protein
MNRLTNELTNESTAHSVNVRVYTTDDLAETLAGWNIGINMPEALTTIEATDEIEMEWIEAGGGAINLLLVHFHPSIPGHYAEGEYPTEAAIWITPSKELCRIAKNIPLHHAGQASPIFISSLYDVKTATTNSKVTRQGDGTHQWPQYEGSERRGRGRYRVRKPVERWNRLSGADARYTCQSSLVIIGRSTGSNGAGREGNS